MLFFSITGTKWHKRRKMLTPAFNFNMLKQYVNILIEEGNYMVQCLKDIEGSTINDLISFISHHTLNAICGMSVYIYKKLFLDIDIRLIKH